MALGSATDWKNAFAAMDKVDDDAWKDNLANTIDGLVTGKLSSPGLLNESGSPAASFTFGKAAFKSGLSGEGTAAVISSAMQAGLAASTITVPAKSYVGTSTPASTFSVVTTVVLDPASITLAVAKVLTIAGKAAVSDASESAVPPIFREAFLLLTMTTTGSNAVSPPAPLTDALRSMA